MKPIQTSEETVKVIEWIVRLINSSSLSSDNPIRVLWMIDEFQRIKDFRPSVINEINSCLHSIFNRCPNGLSIIISFSGYPEKKLPEWLSMEIKDRLDKKPLLLPPLTHEECLIFIKDLLNHYRIPETNPSDEYFPFTFKAIETIIKVIEENAKKCKRNDEPKPRTLMRAFDLVLREAEHLIEKGDLKIIDENFAIKVLNGISLIEEE